MSREEKAAVCSVAFLLLVVILSATVASNALIQVGREEEEAVYVDRIYSPEQTTYANGTVISGGPFQAVVQRGDKKIVCSTDAKTWAESKPGDKVVVRRFSGWLLNSHDTFRVRAK